MNYQFVNFKNCVKIHKNYNTTLNVYEMVCANEIALTFRSVI